MRSLPSTQPKTLLNMTAIAQDLAAFVRLSPAHQSRLRRKAQAFMAANPGAADHSIFWGRLSARQITYTR